MERSNDRLPDDSVRPEVMDMLTTFVESSVKGVELTDTRLTPNEVELAEFPSIELRIGRTSYKQKVDKVYLLNRSLV